MRGKGHYSYNTVDYPAHIKCIGPKYLIAIKNLIEVFRHIILRHHANSNIELEFIKTGTASLVAPNATDIINTHHLNSIGCAGRSSDGMGYEAANL